MIAAGHTIIAMTGTDATVMVMAGTNALPKIVVFIFIRVIAKPAKNAALTAVMLIGMAVILAAVRQPGIIVISMFTVLRTITGSPGKVTGGLAVITRLIMIAVLIALGIVFIPILIVLITLMIIVLALIIILPAGIYVFLMIALIIMAVIVITLDVTRSAVIIMAQNTA